MEENESSLAFARQVSFRLTYAPVGHPLLSVVALLCPSTRPLMGFLGAQMEPSASPVVNFYVLNAEGKLERQVRNSCTFVSSERAIVKARSLLRRSLACMKGREFPYNRR